MLTRSRFSLAVSLVMGTFWLLDGGLVSAQVRGRPRPQEKLQRVDAAGTVEGVVPGWIQIKATAGDQWRLQLTPKTNVMLTGKATPDFVQPGMFIILYADVDKQRSRVQDPVDKFTIFTPTQQRRPGVGENPRQLGRRVR